MNFQISQLPYKQLEQLGVTRERIQQLPKDEMQNLLSGYPSNIKFLVFKDHDGNIQKVNARLSIYQTSEGVPGLKIHPYREKITNDIQLTDKEIEKLKGGSTVQKQHNNRDYLVQLDTSLNELRKVRMDYIKVAEAVGSNKLSEQQKTDLISGKEIQVKNTTGEFIKLSLDLRTPSGIRMESQGARQSRGEGIAEQEQISKEHQPEESIRMKR